MSFHHHQSQSSTRISRVDGPCLLYGSVGVWLSVALQYVGLFKKGDDRLMGVLSQPVFHGQMPEILSLPLQIVMTSVFCYALAFVVLDTAGTWKRVALGITVLVLLLAMVPTLAVWNIYYSPFLPVIGVFWAWFCSMMYVSHHVMPCEVVVSPTPTPTPTPNVKPQKPKGGEEEKKTAVDVNQKYQPKEKANG